MQPHRPALKTHRRRQLKGRINLPIQEIKDPQLLVRACRVPTEAALALEVAQLARRPVHPIKNF
jgi:hypothetical protein